MRKIHENSLELLGQGTVSFGQHGASNDMVLGHEAAVPTPGWLMKKSWGRRW